MVENKKSVLFSCMRACTRSLLFSVASSCFTFEPISTNKRNVRLDLFLFRHGTNAMNDASQHPLCSHRISNKCTQSIYYEHNFFFFYISMALDWAIDRWTFLFLYSFFFIVFFFFFFSLCLWFFGSIIFLLWFWRVENIAVAAAVAVVAACVLDMIAGAHSKPEFLIGKLRILDQINDAWISMHDLVEQQQWQWHVFTAKDINLMWQRTLYVSPFEAKTIRMVEHEHMLFHWSRDTFVFKIGEKILTRKQRT